MHPHPLLLTALLLMTAVARADQLAVLSPEEAERAVTRILAGRLLVTYCSECDDQEIVIHEVRAAHSRLWGPGRGEHEVLVLLAPRYRSVEHFDRGSYVEPVTYRVARERHRYDWHTIDLAYVYVPGEDPGTYRCLGRTLGLPCEVAVEELHLPGGIAAPRLELVARSPRRWTGVAVTPTGRLFVNYPRWSEDVPVSVAELVDGVPRPFPDDRWNAWRPGDSPADRWVCVQSVHCDRRGRLWVLDPASPGFGGVVPGGAKLVAFDPDGDDTPVQVISFDATAAPPDSYLNDVRVDVGRDVAYLTDSGLGALLVVDLQTGAARRVLEGHPSTRAEGLTLNIGGRDWLRDGLPPQVHADGLALSPDAAWLHYQALSGRNLYRISTAVLRDPQASAGARAAAVERVIVSGASDGLIAGADGSIYLSSLEHDAIRRLTPGGVIETVVSDPRLAWPDSFARGPAGDLYVTVARIHEGDAPRSPFALYRVPR
jgi:sugar lactone lactonase YvrE